MRIIALFAALPLLAGCGQKPGATGIDPQDAAKVARGQAVYAASCAACHGAILECQPDFVAETIDTIYMLEPEWQAERAAAIVIAQKEAASSWCANASNHAASYGGKPH